MTEIRSNEEIEEERLERQTSEGAQELQPRTRTQEVVIAGDDCGRPIRSTTR